MRLITILLLLITLSGCFRKEYSKPGISREEYKNKLYGFWLGQSIANWTGLVTEMDKIGNIGDIKTGDFYTSKDWGKPDQPSIWGNGVPSNLSHTIDFVFRDTNEVWGADDDTDLEYMYQHLLYTNKTAILTPAQIRDGWLKHISADEENYLWVSNQQAFDLMQKGLLPPETGKPDNNPHYDMIDAQLTTEIFGLFAPGRPDIALQIADLPISTVADKEAKEIAQFYVVMYSLASVVDTNKSKVEQMLWLADSAASYLNKGNYPAKMYSFVLNKYEAGQPWETTRNELYERYLVNQEDGYDITSRNLYCNGCFAAGINFGASLISLFYGEGDFKKTLKIAVLCGWDSDNPAATWGGLLGFMLGRDGLEKTFGRKFSTKFNIHRTRQNFPLVIDDFNNMAEKGIKVVEFVTQKLTAGKKDIKNNLWLLTNKK